MYKLFGCTAQSDETGDVGGDLAAMGDLDGAGDNDSDGG